MPQFSKQNLQSFNFRNIHPQVLIGAASDRYAGWIGQIYSQDRYQGRITKRINIIGGKSFIEKVLPVESVEEYFEHFSVLEIDSLFIALFSGNMGSLPRTIMCLRHTPGI